MSRKDFLKITSAFLSFSALGFTQSALNSFVPPPVFWRGDSRLPYLSLTFDDCYVYSYLRQLEKLLDGHPSIKVTFFPTGTAIQNAEKQDPSFWSRMVGKGHEMGYHGYNHQYPSKLSNSEMLSDFDKWLDSAQRALGDKPTIRFARPPYGDLSLSFQNLCVKRNLVAAMWSTYWGGGPQVAHQEIENMKSGDIVLFHIDYWDIENAEYAIPLLAKNSLYAVTLSNLYFFSASHSTLWKARSREHPAQSQICLNGKRLR